MSKSAPSLAIEIIDCKRTRRSIVIHWSQGESRFGLEESDNPLPAFASAMDALASLIPTIIHVGSAYGETGLRVTSFALESLGGVQAVSFRVRKDLDDAMKEFAFSTPPRLLAHPVEEGKYTPALVDSDIALVQEAIEQAKQYVLGNRSQGKLSLDDEETDDDDGESSDPTPELPLAAPDMPHNQPAKKRGRPKKNVEAPAA